MDLKDRLEKIEGLKRKVEQINANHQRKNNLYLKSRQMVPISEVIPGKITETPYGSCFFTEKNIPLSFSYGDNLLLDIKKYFPSGLHFWIPQFKKEKEKIKLEEILFLDTETTGLAGGSGTYIFLLGLGYFQGEHFWIRQYFMSDYHEEGALLWAVNQLFAQGFKLLVSYNGKSYDFPLLQTRCIMTRLPLQLNTYYHLDLLFPTRRLWKKRLKDCSLPNIEKNILKVYRKEDIPGYLIPNVYFRYLQEKDARYLKPIFTHNFQDIISLVLLATKISQTMDDPLRIGKFALDLCSIGKIYEDYKDFHYSSKCYEEALRGNLSDEETLETLKLCSFVYKRQGQWERALSTWREIISISDQFLLYPYEELAKYYEHKQKDYYQASMIVKEALQRLVRENISANIKEQWLENLSRRLERIIRKCKLVNSKNIKDKKSK